MTAVLGENTSRASEGTSSFNANAAKDNWSKGKPANFGVDRGGAPVAFDTVRALGRRNFTRIKATGTFKPKYISTNSC